MSTQMGVWIDHRKAIVVAITEKGEEIATGHITALKNNFAVLVIRRLKVPMNRDEFRQMIAAKERSQSHLNIYYDAVIACIREAESILIFGPGEAKGELKERLEQKQTRWTHRRN